jgi:hypothetical protein
MLATSTPPGANAMGGTAGTGLRPGGVVQDGKGTGPGREKTDKGASGYFYGNDKK